MAKRSDFAQKLLDDLRLRKERMAASQSSKSSKPVAGDAYSYSKQAYRGSREMKTTQNTCLKSGRTQSTYTGGHKSVSVGQGSKKMVAFGRGRSSEQFGDLSMALAFALENGGKFIRMDSANNSSVMGFLNQISRRSMEMSKMERTSIDRYNASNSRFPTLSHLHIKEIAKGAQKLNQILKACSNGLNFDRYSVEIGNELLKGAMDLEESLRMLVNLQEASENMIRPQSKTRITLLDEDEDNDDNDDDDNTVTTVENKQLGRPVFSFDKPLRNSHYIQEAARTDLKQRLIPLTYQSETINFHDRQNLSNSNSASHRRSASYSPNLQNLAEFSEQKNRTSSSKSKPEKGRIPNVIAKLMGLEELPENDESKHIIKKESTPKEKNERTGTKKTAEGNSTRERKTKDAGNFTSSKPKQTQPYQVQVTQDPYGFQAQRNLTSLRTSFDGQKDVDEIKLMRSSNKANTKKDRNANNTDQPSSNIGSRKDIRGNERKQDDTKIKEQKGKEKGETKELMLKHQQQQMMQYKQKGSEIVITLQGQAERVLATERRDANKQPSNSQPMAPGVLEFQQPQMHQNFKSQDIKHPAGENDQQSDKQHIQGRRQIGSEPRRLPNPIRDFPYLPRKPSYRSQITSENGRSIDANGTMLLAGLPNTGHHDHLSLDRSSLHVNSNMQDSVDKNSTQNSSPRNINSHVMKEKNRTTNMEEKPVRLPATQKVKVIKAQKNETPRKIDELATRRTANPHNLSRTLKHMAPPVLQELKQRRYNKVTRSKEQEQLRLSRSKEPEENILKSYKSESSLEKSNMSKEPHIQAEQASNFRSFPADNECQSIKGPEILAPNEHLSTVLNDQQGQKGNEKLISDNIELDPLNRTSGGRIDESCTSLQENKKEPILEAPEPLTESENHLKQILIKSELFLNTAEALFKLNIPLGILHAGSNDCHQDERKLILDCGYEVMKRKGKMKELSLHPFMKISITSPKVRSLDDLIRQLYKDFEKLKFHGRNDKVECVVEDYLPKMLEMDIYDKDPDLNCMWDFGWHKMMFIFVEKDDVIRDVEKHVLNGLLDEVTRGLFVF